MGRVEGFIDRLLDYLEDIMCVLGALVMLGFAIWGLKVAFTLHYIAPGYCYQAEKALED